MTDPPLRLPVCEWYLLCTNPATRTIPHPILGRVPACDRCAERAGAKEDPR